MKSFSTKYYLKLFSIRNKNVLFIFFCFRIIDSSGQLSPVYSHHYNFEQFINPAITGRDYYPVVNLSHKKYWLGTKDSPSSICLGASMRIGSYNFYTPKMMLNKSKLLSKERMGIGGFIMNENDGPLNFTGVILNYAYFIPLNDAGTQLSFGFSARFSHFIINYDLLRPLDDGDPELINREDSRILPEAGLGVYLHTGQFYIGGSINELFRSKLPLNSSGIPENKNDFFFQTGYKFFLKYFELEPSAFIAKVDERPLYLYGGLKLYYMNYNWVSVSYKSNNSMQFSTAFKIRRFYIGYIYDQSFAQISRYFQGSHEIMLGINLGLYETPGIRKVVRK